MTAIPIPEELPEPAEFRTKPRGLWQDAFHRLVRNRLSVIGLILVIVGSSSRSTTEERIERTPGGEVRVADQYNRAP